MEKEQYSWQGPEEPGIIIENKEKEFSIPGIYIWSIKTNDGYAPYYVGLCTNLSSRIYGHMSGILVGERTLIDFNDCNQTPTGISNRIAEFKLWENKRNNGKKPIYYPEKINPITYYNNLQKYKNAIDFMIENSRFFFTEISDSNIRSNLENYIIEVVYKKENLVNSQGGEYYEFENINLPEDIINPNS